MNCFSCELERACMTGLDHKCRKKTYSFDIKMSKRHPPREKLQMLPWCVGECKPKSSTSNFEAAKEVLVTTEKLMIEKKRFERKNDMIACKLYMKHEDVLENKEIFFYGYKHVKPNKIDTYILIGCQSHELYEKDKLFTFCCNYFISKEIERKKLKITGWSSATLVNRKNFFKSHSICFQLNTIT